MSEFTCVIFDVNSSRTFSSALVRLWEECLYLAVLATSLAIGHYDPTSTKRLN